jgi:hypothetical protein
MVPGRRKDRGWIRAGYFFSGSSPCLATTFRFRLSQSACASRSALASFSRLRSSKAFVDMLRYGSRSGQLSFFVLIVNHLSDYRQLLGESLFSPGLIICLFAEKTDNSERGLKTRSC